MKEERNAQFETGTHEPVVQENEIIEENVEPKDDVVKYASYKKAVNQLKNQKSELEELREWKKQIVEDEQLKKGNFEQAIKSRDEALIDLKSKLTNFEQAEIDGKKIHAIQSKLPGKISNPEYLSFIDLDSIEIDPESGDLDELTLTRAVDGFVSRHAKLMEPTNSKGLPTVGHLGGRPNLKRSLKDLSRDELRQQYINGNFSN
jgi:hypothetical protein